MLRDQKFSKTALELFFIWPPKKIIIIKASCKIKLIKTQASLLLSALKYVSEIHIYTHIRTKHKCCVWNCNFIKMTTMQNTVPKYICYIYCRKKISGEKQKQTQFNKHLRKVENKSINIIPERGFLVFCKRRTTPKKNRNKTWWVWKANIVHTNKTLWRWRAKIATYDWNGHWDKTCKGGKYIELLLMLTQSNKTSEGGKQNQPLSLRKKKS